MKQKQFEMAHGGYIKHPTLIMYYEKPNPPVEVAALFGSADLCGGLQLNVT